MTYETSSYSTNEIWILQKQAIRLNSPDESVWGLRYSDVVYDPILHFLVIYEVLCVLQQVHGLLLKADAVA